MSYAPERRTLEAFENAVREHEMLGSQPPEGHAAIERRYHTKKANMLALLGMDYVIPLPEDGDD